MLTFNRYLAALGAVYLPLSFVTSLFGMNLKPFAQNTPGSLGLFFSVPVPITVISMLIVLNWTWLVSVATKYGKLPFRKAVYVVENRGWYLRKLYRFLLESDEAI